MQLVNMVQGKCDEWENMQGDRMDKDRQTCEVMQAGNGLQQMYHLPWECGSMHMHVRSECEQLCSSAKT